MFSTPLLKGDLVQCICQYPCPPGFIMTGSITTFIEGRPVARQGDSANNCCACAGPCPNSIITGSTTTFVDGMPVARTIDKVSCGLVSPSSTLRRTYIF